MYNGARVSPDETPKSLEMEDDDVIDAMQEQTGGSSGGVHGDGGGVACVFVF